MKLARACQFAMCAGLAFVLSIALSYAQEVPLTQGQTIQVNVDRVNVGVIVTGGKGNFVQGLKRDHFHVFDNGVEQPISEFAPVEAPGQIFLLVEAGPAVYFFAGHASFCSRHFLEWVIGGRSRGRRPLC